MGIFGKKDHGIFETLTREHREVRSQLDQILAGGLRRIDDSRRVFDAVAETILAHARGEEIIVYPRFTAIEGLRTTTLEARHEHELVEALLLKLDVEELDDESWLAAIKVLRDQLEHHVREEEDHVFARAKDELTADESAHMAKAYAAAKRDLAESQLADQLGALTRGELFEHAADLGIPSQASMSKAELIAVICTRL
jgi:hypothetical protein